MASPSIPVPSLVGTLSGMDVATASQKQAQDEFNAILTAAHAATQQANQNAAAAAQQYQGLAEQPPPQIPALAAFIPTLLSNAASVLGGEPSYRENTQFSMIQQRKALLEARAANLSAAHDNMVRLAGAAEQAGEFERAAQLRQKGENLAKTNSQVLQQLDYNNSIGLAAQKHEYDMELERLRGQNDENSARIRASFTMDGMDPYSYIETTPSWTDMNGQEHPGQLYLNQTAVPNIKARQQMVDFARSNGIRVLNQDQVAAIEHVKVARDNSNAVLASIEKYLPQSGGARRIGTSLVNNVAGLFQTGARGAAIASYPAWRTMAIQSIQALAGYGKGLRINQAEINAAMQYDIPKPNDTLETARAKLTRLSTMLQHQENSILGLPVDPNEVRAIIENKPLVPMGDLGTPKWRPKSGGLEITYTRSARGAKADTTKGGK